VRQEKLEGIVLIDLEETLWEVESVIIFIVMLIQQTCM
jgi:hypothetical protein